MKLILGQKAEEIGLVLTGVGGFEKPYATSIRVGFEAGVVTGGEKVVFNAESAELEGQKSEFESAITDHTRVWGGSRQITLAVIIEDEAVEIGGEIERMKRDFEMFANAL